MRLNKILERKAGEQHEEVRKMTVEKGKRREECGEGQEGGGDELLIKRTTCSHMALEPEVSRLEEQNIRNVLRLIVPHLEAMVPHLPA